MGVHGLWRLLDTFGQVTQPENWRGRTVAIDASIWMAQFRAQTKPGGDTNQQILEGFFVRILKLMFYGIRPVFVFDGPATAAKSAEHRRRQMRRNALSQVYLKRRAQQIMMAQVCAGALNVNELPKVEDKAAAKEHKEDSAMDGEAKDSPEEGEGEENILKREQDEDNKDGAVEEKVDVEHLLKVSGNMELQRNCRRGVQKARRLAPDRVSKKLTHLFLNDAEELIALRKRGEQQLFENTLRHASSSLFMGPRQVFLSEASNGGTQWHAKSGDSDAIVDLVKEENTVNIDEDTAATDAVTIPSSEVSVHGSSSESDADASLSQRRDDTREQSVEVCQDRPRHDPWNITRNPDEYLKVLMTPPFKRTRPDTAEKSAAGVPAVIASDAAESSGSLTVSSQSVSTEEEEEEGSRSDAEIESLLDFAAEDDEEEGSDLEDIDAELQWALEDGWNPTDAAPHTTEAFLWHPNTQIGPPPAATQEAPAQPPVSHSQTSNASSEFSVVREIVAVHPSTVTAPPGVSVGHEPPGTSSIAAAAPVDVRFPLPDTRSTAALRHRVPGNPSAVHGTGPHASRPIPFDLLDLVGLLEACGIPYVLSPAEADAQCALLAKEGLVDAVFTEDSDVVVHGAPIVLRGFFASNKHVVEYQCRDLVTCGVDKRVLVALAYLLGCDYTEGVPGMGLVGALDAVIAAWPSPHHDNVNRTEKPPTPAVAAAAAAAAEDEVQFVLEVLARWHRLCADQPTSWYTDNPEALTALQYAVFDAHRDVWGGLGVPAGFPDATVAEAFFSPQVDDDRTPFRFAAPDWARMRVFAGGHGLLSSSWLVQRFELAHREWVAKHANLAEGPHGTNGVDAEGRRQRRLDDFGVRTVVSEKWAYKKQPPLQAAALARLRAVQQATFPH